MSQERQKCCWECQHIRFHAADPGYSEYTPGSDASLFCSLSIWDVSFYSDDQDSFRGKILTARTCEQFEEIAGNP